MLTVERLDVAYGGSQVLWGVDLSVAQGEVLCLMGRNGVGKTTLLKSVMGLLRPRSGSVHFLGRDVTRASPDVRARLGIGYVPQRSDFDPDLAFRGRDLVRLGIDGHRWGFGLPHPSVRAQVARALASVEAETYADAPIGQLSGGEQQRLRIAQALVGDPRMLLCDEPLANLDLRYQQTITELIAGWQKRTGGTVLFVTHDVNPVLHLVDQVVFVVNGRWAAGSPDEVLTSERMSALYRSHVDVVRVHGRILVVGESTESGFNLDEPHHVPVAVEPH